MGYWNSAEGRLTRAVAVLWAAACIIAISLAGCAATDTAAVYTENGLLAAEAEYDKAYHAKLESCKETAPARTEAAQVCFGEWAKVDAIVNDTLAAAVSTLRAYWIARAQGESPDWARTMADVGLLIQGLPPIAKPFFERVNGVK